MRIYESVKCEDFPCLDVEKGGFLIPDIKIEPEKIKIVMISEATPGDPRDHFYSPGNPFYLQTTVQAFNDAGLEVSSMKDILDLGIYLTTAVKCAKIGYSVSSTTIKNCSLILEREIGLFPNTRAILLMGDVAIKAMNCIAERNIGKRVLPSGSTYKIRRNNYFYKGIRVFPSYLQTGKSYLIEKSKRKMIAEDIKAAWKHVSIKYSSPQDQLI